MATTEPVEIPVQSEEKSEKTSPVKEVKQNGQDGESTTESSAPPDEAIEKKDEVSADKEEEAAVDNHQEKEEEEKGQDEADNDEKTEETAEKEDESEDDESSDEPQKGSLDGPVQIMTGKRERKKVERLSMQSPPEKEKEKLEIKEGRGIKLGECQMVEYQLNKTNADILKPLYRVLFGRAGKVSEIKKHIRKFSGFPFTKEDTAEFDRKEIQLNRFTLGGLKELCTWLTLEKSGTKEDIIQRILDYCLDPVLSKRKPPVKKKKGTKKAGKKRKKVGAKGDATKKKRSHKKKSSDTVEDDDEDDDEDHKDEVEDDVIDDEDDNDVEDDDDDDDDAGDGLDEDSDAEEPKKKKAKKEKPKPAKKTKVKTTPKKSSPRKSPTKKSSTKVVDSDSESSDDDAPLVKKSKSPPSESEMRTFIKNFLEGANLEQVTMKTVCKKVYETYPEFDLTHKKDFIKSTVKEIIST